MRIGMLKASVAFGLLVGCLVAAPASSADAAHFSNRPSTSIGALLATLSDPAAKTGDNFGYSVAVSGSTAVVGAWGTSGLAGVAYIYGKGASGWPNKPIAILADPSATGMDSFGSSVAVSKNTVVVGANGTDSGSGAAYIYVKSASGWPTKPTTTLSDPTASRSEFGWSVAVSGGTAVVSADAANSDTGKAYIYVRTAKGWPTTPTVKLSDPPATAYDYFGSSVAVSGTTAIVGANGTDSGSGAAYIYVKSASGWPTRPTTTLSDPVAMAGDVFGFSVAVSVSTLVVGAFGTGHEEAGRAYIYVKGASGWPNKPTTTLVDPMTHGLTNFAISVAVSGKKVVVGSSYARSEKGVAYIYVKGASGWPTIPTATLSDPGATEGDAFGFSVGVSGRTALIGAFGGDADPGMAYIYKA